MKKITCLPGTKNLTSISESSAKNLQLLKVNTQLASLIRSGQHIRALTLFEEIHRRFNIIKPDQYTLSSALTACSHLRDIVIGDELHCYAIHSGLKSYSHVSNTLLSLYAKARDLVSVKMIFEENDKPDVYSWTTILNACCKLGNVVYARALFEKMPDRNIAVWNAMITGSVENGCDEIGIDLFKEMHRLGVQHDNYSFASILSACSCKLLDLGAQVHSLVIKTGFLAWSSVVNSLITMYFNRQEVAVACCVFQGVEPSVRDQITFNVMINGLLSLGRMEEAFQIFKEMLTICLRPTRLTFVSLLSFCTCITTGHQVHSQVIKFGCDKFAPVSNAAISMYSGFGDLNGAYKVFDSLEEKDCVSWNTMISSYAQHKAVVSAILAFKEMLSLGFDPDEFSFGSLLVSLESVETVEMVQAAAHKYGLVSKIEVSNAFITAYFKHGRAKQAYRVFNTSLKNLISWNTLISGFLENGFPSQSLQHFSNMFAWNLRPDSYTLSIALSICTDISSLSLGKQLHAYIYRCGHSLETSLGNGLVTMYAKCGLVNLSEKVFYEMSMKDIVSWNALISAYAQHGEGKKAILAFEAMQDEVNVQPDGATFSAVLSACNHAGLVDEGVRIFSAIVNDCKFVPQINHFSCVVDILARAGYLRDAQNVINSLNINSHSGVWWVLFSACVAHSNLSLGKAIARLLVEQDKNNPSVYLLLAKIYAAAGQWDEATEARELMNRRGLAKQRGCSWIRL